MCVCVWVAWDMSIRDMYTYPKAGVHHHAPTPPTQNTPVVAPCLRVIQCYLCRGMSQTMKPVVHSPLVQCPPTCPQQEAAMHVGGAAVGSSQGCSQ